MQDSVYLVMNENGVTSMRKTMPNLKGGEYAVRVSVRVPPQFFKRTVPFAELEIPEDYLIEPPIEVDLAMPELPDPDDAHEE